ncbi:MAG: imidazole glycerol phosphate synthase subunit HisF [Rhodobacteraceae bacterium]|nr:imidazole glycerol phosphate synthase subunit HisF [Paracoccaceae bacterium]
MLTKRIIPCLDVKDGRVVKGVRFRNHKDMGDIIEHAERYASEGADELVFYDITASSDGRVVDKQWIKKVAKVIDIPFCVAGGIRSVEDARKVLGDGADKISVNSPALEKPEFISELAHIFGTQCVVVGIDSLQEGNHYVVNQYTGDETKTIITSRHTVPWAQEVQELGAGEIVLNCMNQDGVRQGYDIQQLLAIMKVVRIPVIASGGAGEMKHFAQVFACADVSGALAASVFHTQHIHIGDLKHYLKNHDVEVRL